MAEAHNAVLRPRVTFLEEGRDSVHDVYVGWRRSLLNRFFRTKNSIRNGMWPTSLYNLCFTIGVTCILLVGDWDWAKGVTSNLWWFADFMYISKGLPFSLRVILSSTSFGFVFFLILMYIRRYLLRALLSYRGWMYQTRKGQSWRTLIWGLCVRLCSGYSPSLYSYQASLPKQHVPPLKDTLINLVESLKPLYGPDSEMIEKLKKQSKDFERELGKKLQRILTLKSWWAPNYVSDWWEKYVYLMGRSPLPINSNYYILDHAYWKPTNIQCARAAVFVHQAMCFKQLLDREQLEPLVIRNTVPICMAQYERMFSTTRTPHPDMDNIHHTLSSHAVVFRNGRYYKLSLVDSGGQLLSARALEKQLEIIVGDADNHEVSETEKLLPAFTCTDRVTWAKNRDRFFVHGETVNQEFLVAIESAVAVVVLDTKVVTNNFTQRGKNCLHGDGSNLWADKSFTFFFFADGRMGVNGEHSWADAPVLAHMLEFVFTNEVVSPEKLYDAVGHCIDTGGINFDNLRKPERLIIKVCDDMDVAVKEAYAFAVKNNDDLDLCVRDHNSYGKGFIKTCKVSPDAYVQLALIASFYKCKYSFPLTYESSMTRLFRDGRTETVRSLTQEAVDFVLAMAVNSVDRGLKIRLFRRACDLHQRLYRDCMNGHGIDRHLFALFVLAKGLGNESDFLQSILTLPWTLSTSQQPQQQLAYTPSCDLPEYRDKVCPGGGFGPVSDDGFGVSYMFAGDYRIFFHVSSKHSADGPKAAEFMDAIFTSLEEMKSLFDGPRDGT